MTFIYTLQYNDMYSGHNPCADVHATTFLMNLKLYIDKSSVYLLIILEIYHEIYGNFASC